ncbi:MAG: MFS transporter [Chloroflexi bacterium]|nr:MFS transporter [Chloroflexota bacterium]MBV9596363.1 MFS transporter [Chloroflexota bacterium]
MLLTEQTPAAAPGTTDTVAARLNRLPVARLHWGMVLRLSLGEFFDLYDLFMVSYVGAALVASNFLTRDLLPWFVASGFFGMFVGVLGFAVVADVVGRRSAFLITLLIYSIATLLTAFSPNAAVLLVLRFIAGIGIGAELVIIDTYISDLVPPHSRGRFIAVAQTAGFLGAPAVALVSFLLIPTNFLWEGWRWVMVVGGAGALLFWYLRSSLPESPRWLESRGRHAEAEAIVADFEREVERETAGPLPAAVATPVVVSKKLPFRDIWKPPYRTRTIMMTIFQFCQTFGYYGFTAWATTLVVAKGFTLVTSLQYTFLIALLAPVGGVFAYFLLDRVERKWLVVVVALLIAVFGLGFGFAQTAALVLLTGALVTFCNNVFSVGLHTYGAEIFPTRARATGAGFTYAWSRLSSALSAFIIAALLASSGVPAVFMVIAGAMVIAAGVVALLGPEVKDRPVELLAA